MRDFSDARTYPALPSLRLARKQSRFAMVAPVLARLFIRGIDDELIYRRGTSLSFCAHICCEETSLAYFERFRW